MSSISYRSEPVAGISDLRPKTEKSGIFAFVTKALHASRQLQANRILRRSQHLLAPAAHGIPHTSTQKQGGQQMPVANRPAQAHSTAKLPAQNESGWLAAVAIAFLIVHIVAGMLMIRASGNDIADTGREAISSLYD
jgi:hypothetical protein